MPELPVMPDVSEPNQTGKSTVGLNSISCSGGCEHHQTLTAVFYTPILLLFGGFAALATFPEIAEYAAPWIDDPVSQHVCPASNGASTVSNSCGLTTGCPTSIAADADLSNRIRLQDMLDVTISPPESTSKEDLELPSEMTLEDSSPERLSVENTDDSPNTSN